MDYKYLPYNPKRYATNLRRKDNRLMWDSAGGQEVLIVQTPFKKKATDYIESICKRLSGISLLPDKYIEVLPGVWIKFVTAAEKARNNGCLLNGEASTYTVFSCHRENNVCEIYTPQDNPMISPFCDIPLDISISITKAIKVERKFLKRHEVDTGFWKISFPKAFANSYMDNDLSYRVDNFEIPVNKKMIDHGDIYIYSTSIPEVISYNHGLHIIVMEER